MESLPASPDNLSPDRTLSRPVPELEGRWVRLRTIRHDDMNWIYNISTAPELGFSWRDLPGSTDPWRFPQEFSRGVHSQLVIERKRDGQQCGLVLAYRADQRNRTAYIGGVIDPTAHGFGWPFEALDLFIRYCFVAYDFRKLYAEVIDFNLPGFASVLRHRARQEGILRDYWWVGGAYRDVIILSMNRDAWVEPWQQFVHKKVRQSLQKGA